MIKDRLSDLKVVAHYSRKFSEDGEVYIQMDGDSNDEITEFLKKAQEIRIAIDVMKRNTEEVKKLYSIMLSLPHGNDHNNSEVEDRKMVISQTATQIRKRLKEIENDMPEDEDDEDQSQLSRIKRIQFPTLVCLFAETVKEYYEVLSKYQERYKAMVCQQLKIIDKSATDEELQDLLDKEGTALFVDNIVADTLQAQQLLANVKERHEDLLKIENSVREVRDMFVQMATLMETQGDNVSRIEHHMLKASGYTEHGNNELQEAKKKRKRALKRNRILLIILIIVIGFLVIALLVS